MRNVLALASLVAVVAAGTIGCSGPEKKLGRGINNLTEFARMGEWRRSVEQTAIFEGADTAYTYGFIHGFDRSVARTGIGLYEVLTFPIPSYAPVFTNSYAPNPVYPASYTPGLVEDGTFSPDTNLGFSGGDVTPFMPGSRFKIFEN